MGMVLVRGSSLSMIMIEHGLSELKFKVTLGMLSFILGAGMNNIFSIFAGQLINYSGL